MTVWESLPRQLFGGRKANAEREGLHVPDPGGIAAVRRGVDGATVRQVAAGARLSTGAVSKYLNAARASGVAWPVPQEWDDAELERRVYGEAACRPSKFVMPTCAAIHQELKRHRHVTLQLLWEEYRAEH